MATIKVLSNRKLDIPNQLQLLLGVETENIADKITFQIPLTVGTNGLNSMTADVILLTENTSFKDEIILTDKTAPVDADYILAVWTVERKSLIAPTLTIQIKVASQTEDKVWISSTRDLTVTTEIDADEEILNLYPSILSQLRTDIDNIAVGGQDIYETDGIIKSDGEGNISVGVSADLGYDNSESGLSATEVQSAIDEIALEKLSGTEVDTYLGIDRIDGSENEHLNKRGNFVMIEPPAGGYSNNLYFSTTDSDVLGYKITSYDPDPTQTISSNTVNSSENEKLIGTYLYPQEVSVSSFPSGLWSFTFYGKVSSKTGTTQIGITYFKRTSGGVETDLFTAWSNDIDNIADDYIRWQITNPIYVVNSTDRMGARLYLKTTSTPDITVTFAIGDGYGAYLNNPNRIRHSQLRALNGDVDFQHIDSSEKALLNSISGGITGSKTFTDNDLNVHSITISNGIITAWDITLPS